VDETYEPKSARGSREVSARWMVMIGFGVSGWRRLARWEMRRAFPADGADVKRVGSLEDMFKARWRNASTEEAKGMKKVSVEGATEDRRRRIP
jgi:hypothetical protein